MVEIKSSEPPAGIARRVGAALMQFGRSMEMTKNFAARQLGLHPSDLSCLGYIYSLGAPVSPKQIIAHLEMSSGTGTALLDRLEKAGYISRLPNPDDRRSVLIVLDEEKAARPLSFYKVLRANYAAAMSTRSEAELEAFASLLEAFSSLDLEQQLKQLAP